MADINKVISTVGVDVCDDCELDFFDFMWNVQFNNGTDNIWLCDRCILKLVDTIIITRSKNALEE